MKVFLVKYFLFGNLTKTVVLADDITDAINYILSEDVVASDIESCKEINENGKVLTWCQPD